MSIIQPLPTTPPLDYYHVLGIKRSAQIGDINTAYRTLALQLHPHANSDDTNDTAHQFTDVCEAYTVLTSPKLRGIYDQYGYHKLRTGSDSAHRGATIEPFAPLTTKQSEQLFESFFGTSSPFSVFHTDRPMALKAKPVTPVMATQQINVYVTLEEVNTGVTKLVKVYTQTQSDTGPDEYILVERLVSLDIGKGYRTGTKITYAGQGDAGKDAVTGDLVFVVQVKQHSRFVRRNDDIVYRVKLTLVEALTGKQVQVQTLDGRALDVSLHDMICSPQNSKAVPGEGLPNGKNNQKRGNLVIEFDIQFPETLSVAQQTQLKHTLA